MKKIQIDINSKLNWRQRIVIGWDVVVLGKLEVHFGLKDLIKGFKKYKALKK